jgi:hypothetical protein
MVLVKIDYGNSATGMYLVSDAGECILNKDREICYFRIGGMSHSDEIGGLDNAIRFNNLIEEVFTHLIMYPSESKVFTFKVENKEETEY